jgi:hypothetical protein
MKRRDLERKLRIAGCYLKREGASQSLWINPKTGVIEAVPRHVEIKDPFGQEDSQELECGIGHRTTQMQQTADANADLHRYTAKEIL